MYAKLSVVFAASTQFQDALDSVALLQALHPDLLLVVVHLGCWSARQAVCATDILQWANDGALPFLSLRSLSNPVLEKANASSLKFPDSLLQPTGK